MVSSLPIWYVSSRAEKPLLLRKNFVLVLGHCSSHRGFGLALGAILPAFGSDLGRRPSPLVLGLFVLGLQFAIRQGFD